MRENQPETATDVEHMPFDTDQSALGLRVSVAQQISAELADPLKQIERVLERLSGGQNKVAGEHPHPVPDGLLGEMEQAQTTSLASIEELRQCIDRLTKLI